MVGVRLIVAAIEVIATFYVLLMLRSNPNYKSYGIYEYSDDVLNM